MIAIVIGALGMVLKGWEKRFKPLLDFKKIKKKRVSNPFNFRGAPMVTTFVRLDGS